MKFTFKRKPKETGLRGVGHPYASVRIKVGGKAVGVIAAPSWSTKDGKWGVAFTVKKMEKLTDGNPNCDWMWLFVKERFEEEEEARQWVKEHAEKTLSAYTLHSLDYE